ncbi:hypothetical protein CSKR_114479, partial [Clonorchis sinensis]
QKLRSQVSDEHVKRRVGRSSQQLVEERTSVVDKLTGSCRLLLRQSVWLFTKCVDILNANCFVFTA